MLETLEDFKSIDLRVLGMILFVIALCVSLTLSVCLSGSVWLLSITA